MNEKRWKYANNMKMLYHFLPTAEKKRRGRGWAQRSLRSLFLLLPAAAIGISWLVLTIHDQRGQKAAAEAVKKAGGIARCEPTRLGRLLSDNSLGEVVYASFSGETITDAALVHLQGLTRLRFLVIKGTKVTDAGLVHLQEMSQLELLALREGNVTGTGFGYIEGLHRLKFLVLNDTQVNDAGLVRLRALRQLQWLDIRDTKVTDKGVDELQRALPHCIIYRGG